MQRYKSLFQKLRVERTNPASIFYKYIAGRYRPVSYPDGPITARYRFIKNAYWNTYLCCVLQVVELLLDRSNLANIYEALLQAISAGHEQIAESILKHPKYQGMKKEHKHFGETDHFFNTASEDSPFSSDITPLILAAERNQFEIVQLLLLRGETIRKPHHYYCNCQECSNKLEYDQLRLAKTRLNAYKGLSSGAYISLSSKDPILTAFELARELRAVAKVEKYYKVRQQLIALTLKALITTVADKI